MSRIYDALKQIESPVVRLIEGEQSAQPQAAQPQAAPAPPLPGKAADAAPPAPDPAGESRHEFRSVVARPRAGVPVLPFDGTDRRTAERYRILRTNILHHPAKPRVIGFTSAGPGDGKTTSAINLAGVLALKQDVNVLLIDADLRQGSVSAMLGIEESPGLAEVLGGQCGVHEAIVGVENWPNLFVLPAGNAQANPAELLDSPAWRRTIENLRQQFQFLVVDATPIGVVADYDLVQVVCDGAIVVVRPDHTDRRACVAAFGAVAKGKLLGALVNCTEDWFLWPSNDSYGYYGNGRRQYKA